MENNTKQCGGCGSATCQGGCGYNYGKHHTMHSILKLLVLGLVFLFGFKLGMITGFIGRGYEHGGMMSGGYSQNFDEQGVGMMRGYKNVQAIPATAVTETPVKK